MRFVPLFYYVIDSVWCSLLDLFWLNKGAFKHVMKIIYLFFLLELRPNKNTSVNRVTGPYLNLLVKPRIFFSFLGGKNIF